jgi:hypothetical protein
MSKSFVTYEELLALFNSLGIDPTTPGFYSQPAFSKAREADPFFLDKYAEFIDKMPLDQQYLAHAREEIEAVSRFVFDRTQAGGRLGACVDASLLMQSMLDRRGIWCYVVHGAVTTNYHPDGRTIPEGHYWHWSWDPNIVAGHSWLSAPPFKVVDATLKLQPYSDGEPDLMPDIVLDEGNIVGQLLPNDLAHPDEYFVNEGRALTEMEIDRREPGLVAKIQRMGITVAQFPESTIKYVPCSVSASEYPLEEMIDGIGCGIFPGQLFEEYVHGRARTESESSRTP